MELSRKDKGTRWMSHTWRLNFQTVSPPSIWLPISPRHPLFSQVHREERWACKPTGSFQFILHLVFIFIISRSCSLNIKKKEKKSFKIRKLWDFFLTVVLFIWRICNINGSMPDYTRVLLLAYNQIELVDFINFLFVSTKMSYA